MELHTRPASLLEMSRHDKLDLPQPQKDRTRTPLRAGWQRGGAYVDEKDGFRIDDDVGQRCTPLEYEGDESPLKHARAGSNAGQCHVMAEVLP